MTTPAGSNAGCSAASASAVVSRRGASSTANTAGASTTAVPHFVWTPHEQARAGALCGSSIGTISRSNLPPSEAASARRCDSSEYASSASRDRFHSRASSSADVPCMTISWRSVTCSEIEPPFEPIGTRDIISTPAETTRSSWPAITAAAALKFVCIDEPHCRSTVVAETSTGQPAASTAIRPTFHPCSPICVTQPICTSSISAGSRSCGAISPFSTCAARSSPRNAESVPRLRPIGERTASTMNASTA